MVLRLLSTSRICGFVLTPVTFDSFTSIAIQSLGFDKSTSFLKGTRTFVSFMETSPTLSLPLLYEMSLIIFIL